MARTATLPPQVKKLIKEIAGVNKRLTTADRANWKGVKRTDFPDPMMSKIIDKLAKIEAMRKSGIITGPQFKMAMEQVADVVPAIQDKIAKLNITGGDVLDFGDPAPERSAVRSQDYARYEHSGKYPSTLGKNIAGNAEAQLNPGVRNPLPGLIGSEVPIPEPDPMFPPKTNRAGGAAPQVASKFTPQTIGGPRGKQVASALPPWTEAPKPASVYGMNPSNTRAPALDPRSMTPSAIPMSSGAGNLGAGNGMYNFPKGTPTNAGADRLAEIYPEKTRADKQRKKALAAERRAQKKAIDKTLGIAGKVGRGAVLGLPLLALDYLAPNNAIAASRNEGYGMLEDIGLDVQGGIDSIDNPWLSGGASLLDGLLVDPVMTAVGGAKKFKEMIQEDLAEAKRLKKKRKESGWKPKAYRGGMLANGD